MTEQREMMEMMAEDKEIWAPIEGQEGYEVSTHGRVRSFWKLGCHRGIQKIPRLLKTHRNHFCIDKVFVNATLLVANTFLPNPKNYPKVLRQGTMNNHIKNLTWYDPCEDEEGEEWKNYLDGYAVSNHGRVRSYWERVKTRLDGVDGFSNVMVKRDVPMSLLIKTLNNEGYPVVNIRGKTCVVHILVANLFIPNPGNLPNVDHIDRNRTNNHVNNLRWCTQQQNILNSTIQSNNTSGIKGISKNNGSWMASWHEDGKRKTKTFKSKEKAIEYRKKMVEQHYDKEFYTEG